MGPLSLRTRDAVGSSPTWATACGEWWLLAVSRTLFHSGLGYPVGRWSLKPLMLVRLQPPEVICCLAASLWRARWLALAKGSRLNVGKHPRGVAERTRPCECRRSGSTPDEDICGGGAWNKLTEATSN